MANQFNGLFVAKLRESFHITQAELAENMCIDREVIIDLEKIESPLSDTVVRKVLKGLRVTNPEQALRLELI